MGVKVHMTPLISPYKNAQGIVEVHGNTIGECLKHLVEEYPRLQLFDKDGALLAYLGVYVNKEMVDPRKLDTPVRDGDELFMILMFDGG